MISLFRGGGSKLYIIYIILIVVSAEKKLGLFKRQVDPETTNSSIKSLIQIQSLNKLFCPEAWLTVRFALCTQAADPRQPRFKPTLYFKPS